jgi:hypothetical protein
MGKYLENKELDSVLEAYFEESNKTDLMGYTLSDKKIDGVYISINKNNKCKEETSLSLIDTTYNFIKSNYSDIVKRLSENFGVNPEEMKPGEIVKELKLYQVVFSVNKIKAKNSPTNKDGLFMSYEFCFEPKTAKGKKYFDAVGTLYYVLDTIKGYKLKYGSTYNI